MEELFLHVKDDRVKAFIQWNVNDADWDQTKQFTVPNGGTAQIKNSPNCTYCLGLVDYFDSYRGKIDPSTRYLVITIDKMLGMTNISWKYDVQ